MSDIKRIAVFTSGGDSPGMNAAIRAVVRTAASQDLHVYGIHGGYQGMIDGKIKRMEKPDVANIIHRGGTILKTARSIDFMTPEGRQKAFQSLSSYDIQACIVIGGNGSYTGAQVFSTEYNIPFIGLPGTIDNDIYGTDYTIGFDTACNTAVEAIDKIRDTADSHNRLFFIEVMGRHAGDIALYTGIGSGAGYIFLPETKESLEDLVNQIQKSIRRNKLFNLVIVAEGNENGNAMEIANAINQIDASIETRVAIIGHLQRGGSPTAKDRVLASRYGYEAVIALLNDKTNIAIGIVNDKVVHVPFEDAIQKKKELPDKLLEMSSILAQ